MCQFTNIESALHFIEHQINGTLTFEQFKQIYNSYAKDHLPYYVHVTGTNGKGSSAKLINDILVNSNFKVGLFTSPHMEVSNDRIRINNVYISDEQLLSYINYLYVDIVKYNINFFQIYTLIALIHFQSEKVDFAIIEVGIGGLYDSTNVINGKINIITNIEIDHTDKLGNTYSEIAYQKSGIIKNNSHVITHVHEQSALAVIKQKVMETNSSLVQLEPVISELTQSGRTFIFNNNSYTLNSEADYQVLNAQVALSAVLILRNSGITISDESVNACLLNFNWSGRYELLSRDPKIIVDGAHNIAGVKALIKTASKDALIIFSAMKDKDYTEMLNLLESNFDEVVFVEFDYYRSLKFNDISEIAKFAAFDDALKYLMNKYGQREIIVCGSLYFVSDVKNNWGALYDSNN